MRKFATYFVLFSIGLLLILGGIIHFTCIQINKTNFHLDKDVSILVLGHSHAEGAINDSLVKGVKNYAEGGEAYFYTHLKAKKLLEKNPQIHTIFVEFTNNNMSHYMDNWEADEAKIIDKVPKYSPLMSWGDHFYILKKNPVAYIEGANLTIKKNLNFTIYGKKDFMTYSWWGGYYYNKRQHVDSLLKAQKREPVIRKSSYPKVSISNLHALKEIVALCKDKKVRLFLFRSPQHKAYLGRSTELQFQKIRKSEFGDVVFFDFNNFPLEDKDFADLDHLNYRGARKFSIFFDKFLVARDLKKQ